jgi:hypothetical protein
MTTNGLSAGPTEHPLLNGSDLHMALQGADERE